MLCNSFLRAISLGAGLLLVGCGDAADDFDGLAEAPELEAQAMGGPDGASGQNGESPYAFQANVLKLMAALGVPAASPSDPSLVNPAVEATGLLGTSGGQQVFAYAARCALPAGSQVASGGVVYAGGGILSTTSQWMTTGLSTAQQEDVLTCTVAHLNPVGAHVPIFLSGPSVTTATSAGSLDFTVDEAVWQVKIPTPGQTPVYHAWPRVNLLDACGLLTDLWWITRICGSPLNTCGVQVRYDFASVCTGSNGRFTCNGKPAIQTTLQQGELCSLFGG
jgi:hypothetical protein